MLPFDPENPQKSIPNKVIGVINVIRNENIPFFNTKSMKKKLKCTKKDITNNLDIFAMLLKLDKYQIMILQKKLMIHWDVLRNNLLKLT